MVSVCRLLTLELVKKCYLTALHLLYIQKTHTLKKSCFLDTPRVVGCKCGGSRKCLKNINTRSQPAGMQLRGVFFPTANSRTERGERAGEKIKES